jgi:WD40 repeat protein
VTGTEWEFEDALAQCEAVGSPELLVYRKVANVPLATTDSNARATAVAAIENVDAFFKHWFMSADGRSYRRAFTPFSDEVQFEDLLAEHLRSVIESRLRSASFETTSNRKTTGIRWLKGCPFRGLAAYDVSDAPIFFGRREARRDIAKKLTEASEAGCGFLMLLGASGSGKSSLARAGIVQDATTAHRIAGLSLCRVAVMRPSDRSSPIQSLATALDAPAALPELASHSGGRTTEELLANPERLDLATNLTLDAIASRAALGAGRCAGLLIVVDQFEELFTLKSTVDDAFLRAIRVLCGVRGVLVVATMRSEYLDHVSATPELRALCTTDRTFVLHTPNRAELEQIILRPAQEAGLHFETDKETGRSLSHDLLDAAEGRASLPLLSFTLRRLWEERTADEVMTFEAYRQMKGMEGAIAARAEQVFMGLPESVRDALPDLLKQVTTIPAAQPTTVASRPAPISVIASGPRGESVKVLVDALCAPEARLLVRHSGDVGASVSLAHESLLLNWPRAARIIEDAREKLRLRQQIQERLESAKGDATGSQTFKQELLPDGVLLTRAVQLLDTDSDMLSPECRDYIRASKAAVDNSKRSRRKVRAIMAASLLTLSAAASGFAVLAQQRARDAGVSARKAQEESVRALKEQHRATLAEKEARTQGFAGSLSAAHFAMRLGEGTRNVRRYLEAAGERERKLPEWRFLSAATDQSLALLRTKHGVPRAIDFTASGAEAIITHDTGIVDAWDTASGRIRTLHESGEFAFWGARAAGSEAAIATATGSSIVTLTDPTGSEGSDEIGTLKSWVRTFDVSDAAQRIAAGSFGGEVVLWDTAGRRRVKLDGRKHSGAVVSLAFLDMSGGDDLVLVSADELGTIHTWRTTDGTPLSPEQRPGDWWPAPRVGVVSVVPLEAGLFCGAWSDGTVAVIDSVLNARSIVHERPVTCLASNPDGRFLVLGGATGEVAIVPRPAEGWIGLERATIDWHPAHNGPVSHLAISWDGRFVASGGEDTLLVTWETVNGAVPTSRLASLRGHEDEITAMAFQPGSWELVTAARDGTVRTWDVETVEPSSPFASMGAEITSIACSSNGRFAITGTATGALAWWDTVSHEPLGSLELSDAPVAAIAWDEVADRIAVVYENGVFCVLTGKTVKLVASGSAAPKERPQATRLAVNNQSKEANAHVVRSASARGQFSAAWSRVTGALLVVNPQGELVQIDHSTGAILARSEHSGSARLATITPRGGRLGFESQDEESGGVAWFKSLLDDSSVSQVHVAIEDEVMPRRLFVTESPYALSIEYQDRSVFVGRLRDEQTGVGQSLIRARVDGEGSLLGLIADSASDAPRAIIARKDGSVQLVDADTGLVTVAIHMGPSPASAVALSEDGSRWFVGAVDGTLRSWSALPAREIVRVARQAQTLGFEASAELDALLSTGLDMEEALKQTVAARDEDAWTHAASSIALRRGIVASKARIGVGAPSR